MSDDNTLPKGEFYQMPNGEKVEFAKPKKFLCPTHGEIDSYISSTIKGHEGNWCQICWLETLDRIGVHRVTELTPLSTE